MTYVRVTRDQRGYENTFLWHSARPGEPARVLYWYRSAPGVRVGRAALDEDAIRSIEEQHPEIEFDWHQLLEEASMAAPEIERRPERRRKPGRPRESAIEEPPAAEAIPGEATGEVDSPPPGSPMEATELLLDEPPETTRNPLLEQLVGREIARRLRTRYAEVSARIREAVRDAGSRSALQARADALDPDRWATVDAIVHGVQHADRLFDELRQDIG